MTPASRLPVEPGERVLDLCAAPGGKATALGAALEGQGLLVANDISNSRARALLRNLELFGISNAFVTSETPAEAGGGYFPDFSTRFWWTRTMFGRGNVPEGSGGDENLGGRAPGVFCRTAAGRLSGRRSDVCGPGGKMLYSTCTFSREENEGTIAWTAGSSFPQMAPASHCLKAMRALLPDARSGADGNSAGYPEGTNGNPELKRCVRIWPHKMDGEGHFLALLEKRPEAEDGTGKVLAALQRLDKRAGNKHAGRIFPGKRFSAFCGTG
ncbi:MAG: hypothetical protein ACLRT5_15230 [Lachnospiraceae bacterium]